MAVIEPIYLADYQPCDFIVSSVYLHFELDAAETEVTAVLALSRRVGAAPLAPLKLHGERLKLLQVAIDGQPLSASEYTVDDDFLVISKVPDTFVLETKVLIHPERNTWLMGLYQSRQNFCTQCEAEGFRFITYYFDRPDVLSRFTTTITADKKQYPYLLSNGNLIETKDLENGRHWVRWEDPSLKPCYLFALVAGDFDLLADEWITCSGRKVALQLYVEKGFLHQADYAMASLKNAMRWDETRFGREYDLDIYMIVAVSDFNMGAMENKGLNIFNTKYVLAEPKTATDSDYVAIEGVIGHEYFHNWSGNRVTCRDWFQITLKEGLTVFRDQEFTADMTSPAVTRIDSASIVRNAQFAEDRGPLAHPIRPASYMEINNFYTLTVYRKGAEVIRMVETLITRPVFRQALDHYFERFDGQAVTTEDFIDCMEKVSGHDLTQFRRWYAQAGTPHVTVTDHYDASTQRYTLTIKQTCPPTPESDDKEPFYFPFSIGLLVDGGDQSTQVLIISKHEETFVFDAIPERPIPSLLRNFSAPVTVDYPYTDEQLIHLFEHDTDPFARWNAGQLLATRVILALSATIAEREHWVVPQVLITAFSTLLEQPVDDLSFLSRLLTLPSEAYLHQQAAEIDVHAIHQARLFCIRSLADALQEIWRSHYDRYLQQQRPYVYEITQVGLRSIKNTCLFYLVESQAKEAAVLAFNQFKTADNMTDRFAALVALNHSELPERYEALDIFYKMYSEDPLVMNKWLTLQASSRLPGTFDAVLALMQHEAFEIGNPNNVYALIGGLTANYPLFHDLSGAGYVFLADQVLYLNQRNPQVAARILQPLTQWQRYREPYRSLMKTQLQRIFSNNELSTDIYEMLCKTLAINSTGNG